MRNKLRCLILTLGFLAGCGSIHQLDERWLPLEKIVERPGEDAWATTIGKRIYVADLDQFFERNPEGSLELESILSHELVHSWRQHQHGVYKWLALYLSNRQFRLREELLGYYVDSQIEGLDQEDIVRRLVKYRPSMGTEEEIRVVVADILENPPYKEELPPQLQNLGR